MQHTRSTCWPSILICYSGSESVHSSSSFSFSCVCVCVSMVCAFVVGPILIVSLSRLRPGRSHQFGIVILEAGLRVPGFSFCLCGALTVQSEAI